MYRILFLCNGPSGRSQMAAAFARQIAPEDVEIAAASDRRDEVAPIARQVMEELSITIEDRYSLSLDEAVTIPFDAVITLCEKALESCPHFPGSPARIHWDVTDPRKLITPEDDPVDVFRRTRDALRDRVRALFNHGFFEAILQLRATFGTLLNNMTDGVMAHDAERRIFFFNHAAERITGLRHGDVIGRDCHLVFSKNSFCGNKCNFCNQDTSPGVQARYQSPHPLDDGRMLELEITRVPINTPFIKGTGALIIFRDLSEMVRLRKKLERERGFDGIIGRDPAMQKLFTSIQELADVNVPILITGESGTGKEMVAQSLHRLSTRHEKPFVAVNCAALPEGTLASELFGHVKGAFTSAIRDKKGCFELANGGTIFLDEIGEIAPLTQVKLLRVLQEKSFLPVGGEKSLNVDVRILCATNTDLKKLIRQGQFREDLYYRLAVIPLNLPPLRERRADIPLLVDSFLEKYSTETGKNITTIHPEAIEALKEYDWPGNVRELANAVQFAMIQCHGTTIGIDHLPPELFGKRQQPVRRGPGRPVKVNPDEARAVLEQTGGNLSQAAALLKVSRVTLYRLLKRLEAEEA